MQTRSQSTDIGNDSSCGAPQRKGTKISYSNGKVSGLFEPSNSDSASAKIASFTYGQGRCDVIGSIVGNRLAIAINSESRISHIQQFSQNNIYKQMRYFWGTEGKRCGNLLAKALCNPSGEAFYSTYLIYDDRGNVIKETL